MFYPRQAAWLDEAERLRPRLFTHEARPVGVVRFAPEPTAFQGWAVHAAEPGSAWTLMARDAVILDFGEHGVGSFRIRATTPHGRNDAPIRLRLSFAEVPVELAEPDNIKTATLSHAWRQEEVLVLDRLPATATTTRRHAFRYARVEWADGALRFPLRLDDARAVRTSSAPFDEPAGLSAFAAEDLPLARIALRTLRNCMQDVFEDGPKRDRRLWLGDLRLQALADGTLFRRFDLTRRCLLLFAGLADAQGLVPGCLYDDAPPVVGSFLVDYAALFGPTLAEYVRASGDDATGRELLPVAVRQAEWLADELRDGPYRGGKWVFIDWCDALDRDAALAGVAAYALRETAALAERLEDAGTAERLRRAAERLRRRAREDHYDADRHAVVSGPDRQISWAGWAWWTLSGLLDGGEAAGALRRLEANPDALAPAGPYVMHHVVDALIRCGLPAEALARARAYWGGMARAGLTTYPEVWDPADDRRSPYQSAAINSYCHAWSCTFPWLVSQARQALA